MSRLKSQLLVRVRNKMECSVCYTESGPFVKLCCSHEFCAGCIKTWYLKGTGTGCPMCRRPMYWKGFHKTKAQWDQEAYEVKTSEVFSENVDSYVQDCFEAFTEAGEEILQAETIDDARWAAIDSIESACEDMEEMIEAMDTIDELDNKADIYRYYKEWVSADLMRDLRRMESTLRFLKSEDAPPEVIDDALYSLEYFSDRNINKWRWYDDPPKEKPPQVGPTGPRKGGKRVRAREDPWSEMTLYMIL